MLYYLIWASTFLDEEPVSSLPVGPFAGLLVKKGTIRFQRVNGQRANRFNQKLEVNEMSLELKQTLKELKTQFENLRGYL